MNANRVRHFLFALAALCLSAWAVGETYTYDKLDRLTAVAYPNGVGQTYRYDAAGNLLAIASTGGGAPASSYTLTVTLSGSGAVSGSGINCGSACSASLASGSSVTLIASVASGSTFAGWSGDCSGLSACVVTMSADRTVSASFTATPGGGGTGGAGTSATQTLTVTPGWNLLGNGLGSAIGVAELGNATQLDSVWKWQAATSRWAFYTPSMTAAELAAYAQSKGYDVLTAIGTNEGFWVNAKQAASLHSLTGTAEAVVVDTLPKGWSLLGSGVGKTPAEFNAGSTVQPGVTSLWAWDAAQKKWLFYAPSLVSQGGSALSDYLASKGYLDFAASGRTLAPGTGFWINRP